MHKKLGDTMYNNFNYRKSINDIKSILFDIYEDQEMIVGSIENEKEKNEHVAKYINVKNEAVDLLNAIEELYEGKITPEPVIINNEQEPRIIDNLVKNISMDQPQIIEEEKVEEDFDPNKFYLDDRNGTKPNYAYVPEALYNKIKNNNSNNDIVDNKIYKQDKDERKGIIVRNDQYMKLSLSRHRQEGVLKEAKEYRIELARKNREKLRIQIDS